LLLSSSSGTAPIKRNDLYLYLQDGEFSQDRKKSAKNVEISLQVGKKQKTIKQLNKQTKTIKQTNKKQKQKQKQKNRFEMKNVKF